MTYRFWPKNDPIPEGWVMVDDLKDCHHGRYSVLIMQK
jgi:uncharacterized protein YbdZ (MbtH family)